MKNSTRKNKVIKRKDKKNGAFTTVHNSFLNDKRLSPIAIVLFIMITSDSDDYVYSRQRYINMLNVNEKTYQRAFDELVEAGYARVSKFKETNFNNYLFSEYGNLNVENNKIQKDKVEKPKIEQAKEETPLNEDIETFRKTIETEIINYIDYKYGSYTKKNIEYIKLKSLTWFNDLFNNDVVPTQQDYKNKIASFAASTTSNRVVNSYYND